MNLILNKTRIFYIFSFLLLSMLLGSGCRDENPFGDEVARRDNMPVEIVAGIEGIHTRGVQYAKKQFDPFDYIQVQGSFHMTDGSIVTKYAAMVYDGDLWSQYRGNSETNETLVEVFTWPNNAVTADFTAYYIYGNDSMLPETDNPDNIPATSLSGLAGTSATNPDKDPLVARSTGVRYGHTINLQFKHACAYLMVEEIPAGTSTTGVYWFTREKDGMTSPDFYNAYKLVRNTDNTLTFSFEQIKDPNYGNAVYVVGTTSTDYVGSFEKSIAGFYLAPGDYSSFIVAYPGSSSMEKFISYTKKAANGNSDGGTNTPEPGDPDGNEGNSGSTNKDEVVYLEENNVYSFNISNSAGITVITEKKPDEWDEGEDPIYDVDAEKFLWAVCKVQDYVEGGVLIIEADGQISRLKHNVNIQWAEYDVFPPSANNGGTWFDPIITDNVTFDGGLHYIWNLGAPLFSSIDGNVRNLGIANANITMVSKVSYLPEGYSGNPFELNRRGALCGYLNNGSIENIRVKNTMPTNPNLDLRKYRNIFSITAQIQCDGPAQAHSIGGLIGSINNGAVKGVELNAQMTLTVENYSEEYQNPVLSIGGLVGQSLNEIYDIEVLNTATKISLFNNCKYALGSYYVGGILGVHNGGTVNSINIPSIMVDARKSEGWISYLGGIVGGLSNDNFGGTLENCRVMGSVFAGKSQSIGPDEDDMGRSYTGGIAGECFELYTVVNCDVAMDVYGPYNETPNKPEGEDPEPGEGEGDGDDDGDDDGEKDDNNPGDNNGDDNDNNVGDTGDTGDSGDTGDNNDDNNGDDNNGDDNGEGGDSDNGINNYVPEGTFYATGGMFGVIQNAPGLSPVGIRRLSSSGKLRGPIEYIGNFAGVVPTNESWDETYVNNDIIIQQHTLNNYPVKNIGASMMTP